MELSLIHIYTEGSVPVSTLRENVDYAEVPAGTKSGYVGVKVWIARKEDEPEDS